MLNLPYYSSYQGETKIVDGTGQVLERLTKQDGAGVIVAEIQPGSIGAAEPLEDGIYIPKFSFPIRVLFDAWWTISGIHGKWYYARLKKKHPETFVDPVKPFWTKTVQNGSEWHETVQNGS